MGKTILFTLGAILLLALLFQNSFFIGMAIGNVLAVVFGILADKNVGDQYE